MGSVRFAAVGDISMGDQPFCLGTGVRSIGEVHGYTRFFEDVAPVLRAYPLVLGNLESVVAAPEALAAEGRRTRIDRADPAATAALRWAGFTLMSVANNHIFEFGPKGLEETLANVQNAGLAAVGQRTHKVVEIGGKIVGVLAWSLVPDRYYSDLNPADFYNVAVGIEPVLEEVDQIRQQVDWLVVSLHWGNEFLAVPSAAQVEAAHRLVDAGVSVVIGHHPHVLQPIERYRGGVIAYSLGNFISDYWQDEARSGVILEVTLGDTVDVKLIPTRVCRASFHVLAAISGDERAAIMGRLNADPCASQDNYATLVYERRRRLRSEYIRRLATHFWRMRVGDLFWLVGWGWRRLRFLISIRGVERNDPDAVYRGGLR